MEWINIEEQKPPKFKMIIIDTDKGIAVAQYDGFGKISNVQFEFGRVQYGKFEICRWMPMPER